MHLRFCFSTLLACSTLVFALSLPGGLKDGLYHGYVNAAGHEIHEWLAAPNNTNFVDGRAPSIPLPPKIKKRASGASFCGCGKNMNHGDCDAANQDLYNQVARISDQSLYMNPGVCWYSIRGSAVAFVCNPYQFANYNPFHPYHIRDSSQVVTNDCGWYVAGTYAWGFQYSLLVGYMIYYPGLDFFGNAMGSNARNC